jgi:hypothetical protein
LAVKAILDGTTFSLDRQLDILKRYSKIISLLQDNGIVPRFGPRTSCWLYGNLDGQFENTGMRYSMTAQVWKGSPKENSTTA